MRLEIRRQGLEIDPLEESYIERRLLSALSRFAPRIQRIAVYVSDQNGPKGGSDKRCRLVVSLLRQGVVTVEDQDSELAAVVDRAADRLARAVHRLLDRRRRSPGAPLAAAAF